MARESSYWMGIFANLFGILLSRITSQNGGVITDVIPDLQPVFEDLCVGIEGWDEETLASWTAQLNAVRTMFIEKREFNSLPF